MQAVAYSLRSSIRARGFSLVEIMVALAVSMLLLAGVIAIFGSSRASYETTDKLSRIQENGRFAIDQIVRDIRAAGYVGCARAPTYLSSSLNVAATAQWDFLDGPVRGFQSIGEDTWTPGLTNVNVTQPSSGSDVLLLRVPRRDAEPLRLTADMASGSDSISVPNVTSGLRAGDIALVYSCEAQSYFQVTSFAGGTIEHTDDSGLSPGNVTGDIQYAFRKNAEVVPVHTVLYYLRASTADATTTSLWRRTGLNSAEELVEGVERMELEFGLDTNGDTVVDDYVTADAVGTNWGNVYSVSVALLVRSPEQYGTDLDKRTYRLLSVDVDAPNDRYMREVFSATANLRNRVPVD